MDLHKYYKALLITPKEVSTVAKKKKTTKKKKGKAKRGRNY